MAITGKSCCGPHTGAWKVFLAIAAGVRHNSLYLTGPIAQLGERHNGIVEVSGSIPLGSTQRWVIPTLLGDRSSVWLERRPVKAEVAGSSPVGPAPN